MKKMMYDSLRLALVLVAMTAGLASCGKDEVTGRVNLATDLLVIDEPGDTRTVNFTTSHVRSLSVSTTPEGWKAEADLAAGVLTVTHEFVFQASVLSHRKRFFVKQLGFDSGVPHFSKSAADFDRDLMSR